MLKELNNPYCKNPVIGSHFDSLVSEVYNMDCVEGMKHYPDNYFDLAICDPPYEVKELTKFLEFVDEHLNETGKAILLIPSGFLDKQRPANLVQLLNKFFIELREPMTEKFERTGAIAEIVVLSK